MFITQSGSCTLWPPRLLCCFPLHRRQISSDMTSSPLSSTATKTSTSKGLAWRLNKSACNSGNFIFHQSVLRHFMVFFVHFSSLHRPRSEATTNPGQVCKVPFGPVPPSAVSPHSSASVFVHFCSRLEPGPTNEPFARRTLSRPFWKSCASKYLPHAGHVMIYSRPFRS